MFHAALINLSLLFDVTHGELSTLRKKIELSSTASRVTVLLLYFDLQNAKNLFSLGTLHVTPFLNLHPELKMAIFRG